MTNIKESYYYTAILGLLAVALFWNLGITPIGTDEPTRTIVAQELKLTDNMFVATINGENYYNKPPIYNWLLLGIYNITDSKSEFVTRIPVVVSVFLFLFTLFYWCKNYMNKSKAFLVGLVFATSARLLYYDSMLGLIDLLFGWMILITFILLYELDKKEKYYLLFTLSYAIIAICFLMKGLQAIAFQGMTILGWYVYKKEFKKLFSLPHFVGMGLFLLIIGAYLFTYNLYHPVSTLLETLWTESSKRTIGAKAWYEDLSHILLFPLKNILADILPWGIFLFGLCIKRIKKEIYKNELATFVTVIFLVNSIVYWFSPETRGRYLYPHYALLSILIVLISDLDSIKQPIIKFLTKPLNIISVALPILGFFSFLLIYTGTFPQTPTYISIFKQEYFVQGTIMIIFLLGATAFLSLRSEPLFKLAFLLISIRFVFNAYVIPSRAVTEPHTKYKNEALRIGAKYTDKPLLIYRACPIDHFTTHYLLLEQNRIIPRVQDKDSTAENYYMIEKWHLRKDTFEIIDSFPQAWENRTIYIAK